MKSRIAEVLVVLMVAVFAACDGRAEGGRVSLISLVAEPDKFLGREVTVVGYHASGLEPPLLYLTKEQAQLNDWPSGVLLYETIEGTRFSALMGCQDQYVMVIGRFALLPTEEPGITDIVRVVALGDGRGASKICFNSEEHEKTRKE